MDIEQILFLIIAIALSLFSMYRKAKKQKQSSPKNEEVYDDFYQEKSPYDISEPVVIFEQNSMANLPQNTKISTKKNQKDKYTQNIKTTNLQIENQKNILQNADLENQSELLDDFDGTEIQKAFLYSEIFKNTIN